MVLVPVEDADPYGRDVADVVRQGRTLGRVIWVEGEAYLIVHQLQLVHGAPDDVVGEVLELLTAGKSPPTLYHYEISRPETLRWYADSRFADGVVLSGFYGEVTTAYDPLRCLDLSTDPTYVRGEQGTCMLTLCYGEDIAPVGENDAPDRDAVWVWLREGGWLRRTAALRRVLLDPVVPPALGVDAHLLAMSDEQAGVRQMACTNLAFAPKHRLPLGPDTLLRFCERPLEVRARFGQAVEDLPTWRPTIARANARLAAMYTLGVLAMSARAAAPAWVQSAVDAARAAIRAYDPARDALLMRRVVQLFGPEGRQALGEDPDLGIAEVCRFFGLRWQAVNRLGLRHQDRYYWMIDSVNQLLGEDAELARIVHGPMPDVALPGVDAMPDWMAGTNHLEAP